MDLARTGVGTNGDGVAPPKETRVVLGADVGVAPPGDRGAADKVRAPTPDDSFASPSFANSHGWQHANPLRQTAATSSPTPAGASEPTEAPTNGVILGPDDDVRPTGFRRVSEARASELMANNLQKLNVSPAACQSPRTTAAGSDPPGHAQPEGVRRCGVPSSTTPLGGTTAATMDTSASAMSTGRSESDKDVDDKEDTESVERRVSATLTDRGLASFPSATGHEMNPGQTWDTSSEKIFLLRRRSALSQQLARPLPPLVAPSFVAPSFVLPADVSMVLPSSPSADPSPRTDLRKQAIMKRMSLLHSTPNREFKTRDPPTSPTAAFHPRFPAGGREGGWEGR